METKDLASLDAGIGSGLAMNAGQNVLSRAAQMADSRDTDWLAESIDSEVRRVLQNACVAKTNLAAPN